MSVEVRRRSDETVQVRSIITSTENNASPQVVPPHAVKVEESHRITEMSSGERSAYDCWASLLLGFMVLNGAMNGF